MSDIKLEVKPGSILDREREFTTCDASEDGACYFSADIAKLTAERDALLETVDALRTETERCRVELRRDPVLRIRDLLADNDRLKAAGKGLCSSCGFPCSVVDETEELRADITRLRAEVERQSNLITAWENAYAVGELRPTYEALKTQLTELREAAEACIREMWGLEPDEPIVAAPVEPISTFERLAWVLAKLPPSAAPTITAIDHGFFDVSAVVHAKWDAEKQTLIVTKCEVLR